jgi:nitronate monooxygenase
VSFSLDALEHPIVQAPMGGGPSTPELAAAVSEAGGLGFLAAGYKTVDAVRADIEAVRARTSRPFGINLFVPPTGEPDRAELERYARSLEPEAERYGTELGAVERDDDAWDAKLSLFAEERVPVVSFNFGCPPQETLAALDAATWVNVTTPQEAQDARDAGADAVVVQGVEAGGHRASFDDGAPGTIGLLALLQLVAPLDVPMVATGGIATRKAVAAVIAAGATAAQLGTAFMRCPEAGTAAVHRAALGSNAGTALTRAFTGRLARGIRNRFMEAHGEQAPIAYPELHHVTSPLRAAGRANGDLDMVNLWAGEAHQLAQERPAGELVEKLTQDARSALAAAARRLGTTNP